MNAAGGHAGSRPDANRKSGQGTFDRLPLLNSARARGVRKFRRILDAILILLVLMIVAGTPTLARAGSGQRTDFSAPAAVGHSPVAGVAVNSTNPHPVLAPLDDNTLAAVIAAENSALTPPIYFVDLPLISR